MVEVCIIDYGMGNLRSIQKGLEKMGATAEITADKAKLDDTTGIVLPGVGAFEDAMKNLKEWDLIDIIKDKVDEGTPFLGVCLGLQLLFEESTEGGLFKGLGILPGRVERFSDEHGLKIPHMGWNELVFKEPDHYLLEGVPEGSFVYFVHSYYAQTPGENIVAASSYGTEFPAIVRNKAGNLSATQFHPEKSSTQGLKILENFLKYCKK